MTPAPHTHTQQQANPPSLSLRPLPTYVSAYGHSLLLALFSNCVMKRQMEGLSVVTTAETVRTDPDPVSFPMPVPDPEHREPDIPPQSVPTPTAAPAPHQDLSIRDQSPRRIDGACSSAAPFPLPQVAANDATPDVAVKSEHATAPSSPRRKPS